jgi:PAS domain S-box-containing protein
LKNWLDNPHYDVSADRFDPEDGLPGFAEERWPEPSVVESTSGILWFATDKGIAWIDPETLGARRNRVPPAVFVNDVIDKGEMYSATKGLLALPARGNLEFNYTALSLAVPERVLFRYKLEGIDTDWQSAGARRQAFYTNLSPGKYRFHVIACNNDGVWNEEGAYLAFVILPAWYQTIWFQALCLLGFCTLLWAAYQLRVHELRVQEKKFRDAVETMPALAFVADPLGSRTFLNRGWLEYAGLSSEHASGSGWQAAVHPDDLKRVNDRWSNSLATGDPLDYEARLRRGLDGTYRWFQTRARPLRDNRGKIVKWCGVANDIEDRKRAEQLQADLTHASRVSTMGELVASISHELAQPITATANNAKASLRWLQSEPPDLNQVRKGTESIIEASKFASEIINRLRSLYKKAPPKREFVSIRSIVAEMAGMMRGEARGHGISIRTDLDDDLPMTVADRVQLQQVFMNLILNGIEAMKETGGVLSVKAHLCDDGEIEVAVKDTGPGLPPDRADQIFDAFFTTKPEGSGMGLAICKSIIESQGGRIWADSNSGRGATFHFTLPTVKSSSAEVHKGQ